MKNDTLKKHHFWFLLGAVPLFTLIAVLVLSSKVGGRIDARQKEISDENSAIKSKSNPKPKSLLAEADQALVKIEKRKGGLHEENWNRQKYLFTWPAGATLLRKNFDPTSLKFGSELSNREGEFDQFIKNEVYLREFSSASTDPGPATGMADTVAPTQFKDGWKKVLRYVDAWGQSTITKDQIWLAMEDIWVQRSLLDAVRSVDEGMARFHRATLDRDKNIVEDPTFDDYGRKLDDKMNPIPTPDAEKFPALFRNRVWAIELKLEKEGTATKLTGVLTNLSERLQLMGSGNIMTLNVWFANAPVPMPFVIGGEFLAGKGSKKNVKVDGRDVEVPANVQPVITIPSHFLPTGVEPTEIVRVEQVFDIRTVPVKRIDALVFGHTKALDSRNAAAQLLPPGKPFAQEAAPSTDAAAPTGGGPTPGATGPAATPPGAPPTGASAPPPTGSAPPPGMGGGGFPGSLRPGSGAAPGSGTPNGGGTIAAIIDGNKKRYLAVTDQVRRMPVGIVVVVDQAYMEDMLLAFANSPLRFQITQVEWRRFNDQLAGIGTSSPVSPFGPSSDIDFGSGFSSIKGLADPDSILPYSTKPTRPGGSSGGPPKPGLPGPGGSGPSPFGPSPFGPSAGAPTTSSVSETQITAGLIELCVYGVVSLYEKFDASKPGESAAPVNTPAPTKSSTPPTTTPPAPTNTGPMTTGPMTPAPMTTGPMTPAPMTTGPMTPAPMTNVPMTPAPMTPAPAPPAPGKETAPTPPKMRRRVRRRS
jgi:hypothetical protein